MKSIRRTVYALLAHHVGGDVREIHAWQHLEDDLDLTPLELVLLTVELEAAEGVEVSVEDLAAVETVGQLVAALRRLVARARRAKGVMRVA